MTPSQCSNGWWAGMEKTPDSSQLLSPTSALEPGCQQADSWLTKKSYLQFESFIKELPIHMNALYSAMQYCCIMYYICQPWNFKEFKGYLVSRSCNHLCKHEIPDFPQTSCHRNIATWHDTWLVLIQRQNSILSTNLKHHREKYYTNWRPQFLKIIHIFWCLKVLSYR